MVQAQYEHHTATDTHLQYHCAVALNVTACAITWRHQQATRAGLEVCGQRDVLSRNYKTNSAAIGTLLKQTTELKLKTIKSIAKSKSIKEIAEKDEREW